MRHCGAIYAAKPKPLGKTEADQTGSLTTSEEESKSARWG
jgi:hypothetical protein